MTKKQVPGTGGKSCWPGTFFMPGKQMMHFDPGDSTPDTHTDTVDQNITRNERREKIC